MCVGGGVTSEDPPPPLRFAAFVAWVRPAWSYITSHGAMPCHLDPHTTTASYKAHGFPTAAPSRWPNTSGASLPPMSPPSHHWDPGPSEWDGGPTINQQKNQRSTEGALGVGSWEGNDYTSERGKGARRGSLLDLRRMSGSRLKGAQGCGYPDPPFIPIRPITSPWPNKQTESNKPSCQIIQSLTPLNPAARPHPILEPPGS